MTPRKAKSRTRPSVSKYDDRVTHLPGYGPTDQVQFAGYAAFESDEALFYWFVGAKDHAKKPTILWSNGGPGSSSFWGFFLENGPYAVNADGKSLTRRPHAWNEHANYLIFEHPLSVTLSVAQRPSAIPKTVEQGVAQLYRALLTVVQRHPELADNPLVLAGESYAGTYLPLLAQAIVAGNEQPHGTKLDLRLMVLCDAWVNPPVQMATDTAYALSHGLIDATQKQWLDTTYAQRLPEINAAIQKLCGVYMTNTAQLADPPFQPILDYLNLPAVRKALHVPASYPKLTANWSKVIGKNYAPQVNDSYAHVVQALLDGDHALRVRAVSGLNDAKDCNFLGTGAWLEKLQGPAAYAFTSARATQWKDAQGHVLGLAQGTGQLGWLKVLNAGHMAARDQPALIQYVLDALPR